MTALNLIIIFVSITVFMFYWSTQNMYLILIWEPNDMYLTTMTMGKVND